MRRFEAKLAETLEELCEEIREDLECAESNSPEEKELEETLDALEEGQGALYDAWYAMYNINMKYDLDAPGKATTGTEAEGGSIKPLDKEGL